MEHKWSWTKPWVDQNIEESVLFVFTKLYNKIDQNIEAEKYPASTEAFQSKSNSGRWDIDIVDCGRLPRLVPRIDAWVGLQRCGVCWNVLVSKATCMLNCCVSTNVDFHIYRALHWLNDPFPLLLAGTDSHSGSLAVNDSVTPCWS